MKLRKTHNRPTAGKGLEIVLKYILSGVAFAYMSCCAMADGDTPGTMLRSEAMGGGALPVDTTLVCTGAIAKTCHGGVCEKYDYPQSFRLEPNDNLTICAGDGACVTRRVHSIYSGFNRKIEGGYLLVGSIHYQMKTFGIAVGDGKGNSVASAGSCAAEAAEQ
jgi:hypothetical protein